MRGFLLSFVTLSAAWAQTPVITTIAGATAYGAAPVRGFSGDNGPATGAALSLANLQNQCDPARYEQASHISTDGAGNLYIADAGNQRIRRIDGNGVITTIAGTGERPAVDSRCEATGSPGDGGPAAAARFYNPSDVVLHPNGSLIVADELNNRIRQISPAGAITTLAGNGTHNLYAPGIPATSSPLDWPSALAVDAQGVVYFAELHGNRVAKIAADGRLVTVAGTGFPGFNGDRIAATAALLTKPAGLAVDGAGNVYIADTGNHRVRRVTPDGQITTIAGTGQRGFSGDGGAADLARLDTPMDVKVDARGNVYIADTGNHRVRRVDTNRAITTVAGTGEADRGRDFTDAALSALNSPSALAIDGAGNVFVVDWQNYLIRKISFDGRPALTPSGVVNAASFREPVAAGSIITLFGANLGATLTVTSEAAWPVRLGGVSVEVNGAPIPLYVVSPGQIAGQLPPGIAPGSAQAVARVGEAVSNTVTFPVAGQAPGIFSLGGGRAAAQNQDFSLNTATNPEASGNIVVVYSTGLTGADTTATIGGIAAEVLYAGPTPGAIGLAQANLRIPQSVAPGSAVPVLIRAGGQTSNALAIAVR